MMQSALKIPVYKDLSRKIRIEKPEPSGAHEPKKARPGFLFTLLLVLSYLCSLGALFLFLTL